jgi:hypothetical protein
MYSTIRPWIYEEFGIQGYPELSPNLSFILGHPIAETMPKPLVFKVDNTQDYPPLHFLGRMIPVMSKGLVDALITLGIDNLQLFEAVLLNEETGEEWKNYFAVNIIGIIACADLTLSESTKIAERPGSAPALHMFEELVINFGATRGALMFRLAESPGEILIHGSLLDALERLRTLEEWGITSFPVEEKQS